MASVTQRIHQVKQPYGGYLRPSEFQKTEIQDENILKEENISAGLVGMTVDYMTRYMMGTPKEDSFRISLMGAMVIGDSKHSYKLLRKINGLDDKSIYNACQLVGYDVCFRAGPAAYKNVRKIDADADTINNIRIMVERGIRFFEEYGPIVKDGFTFEGGYTEVIDSGDGDYLTSDTLWDFKVSSALPKSSHTLQLLIYYIMGKHSVHREFDSIKKLGIFNPRLNCVFVKEIEQIPDDTIETVSKEVIGYKNKNGRIVSSDDLTLAEVMKELECTRYMVMKYYSEEGLPLKKINNKYYINRNELYEWILKRLEEEMHRRAERRRMAVVVFLICAVLGIFLLFFLKIFS